MRACAYGLRSMAPWTIPGSRTSSRYVPLPRMKRASSLRFRRPKPIGRSVVALGRFSTVAMLMTSCFAAASYSAAQRTALTMFLYPVQRQMAPEIAVRISWSVGSGFSSSSARAVINMPGVQNPHWSACCSWKPIWTGSRRPSTSSDSTVRISCPSHIAARIVHDLTGSPSICTTQAPQLEVSQPQWVPVRPGVSRMKWTSS